MHLRDDIGNFEIDQRAAGISQRWQVGRTDFQNPSAAVAAGRNFAIRTQAA
jgi:hypothetical protein